MEVSDNPTRIYPMNRSIKKYQLSKRSNLRKTGNDIRIKTIIQRHQVECVNIVDSVITYLNK